MPFDAWYALNKNYLDKKWYSPPPVNKTAYENQGAFLSNTTSGK